MADENPSPQEEGQWSVYVDSNNYQILGFLQMCIERRFHMALQERFQEATGLRSTDYWIHTDVGGSPKMEENVAAPDYCYAPPQNARIMGWSAHGSKCGGFGDADDDEIMDALRATLNEKPGLYPDATHLAFFAKDGTKEDDVVILVLHPETKK